MFQGSCLCGAVAFELPGPFTPIQLCHARRCRKATGAAIVPEVDAPAAGFRFVRGEAQVRHYTAPLLREPPRYRRGFCSICGSPVPVRYEGSDRVGVPPGLLDDDPGTRPAHHAFFAERAPWQPIEDRLPRHPGRPSETEPETAPIARGQDLPTGYVGELRAKVGKLRLHLPAAGVALRDAAGRVLLARPRGDASWVLPGGMIEPDESPAAAAVREVHEETGLDVRIARLVGVYGGPECTVHYANGDVTSYVMTIYEASAPDATPRPDGDEIEELRFADRAESAELPLARWLPQVLDDVFRAVASRPAGR